MNDYRHDTIVGTLQQKDRALVHELSERMKGWQPVEAIGLSFRNAELTHLAKKDYTTSELKRVEYQLERKGTLHLPIRKEKLKIGEKKVEIATIPATTAETHGDMSSKVWVRDQTLAGEALLHKWALDPHRYEKEGKEASDILLSSLDMMSTPAQLDRFYQMIASDDEAYKSDQHNWPYIALEYDEASLSGEKLTPWRHIQDAFQMLTVATFEALDKRLFSVEDLDEHNKQFLASVVPFLASVDFTNRKNSGSWEEIPAVKTSVLAVETAALAKIREYAKRPGFEFLEKGFESTKEYLPNYKDASFTKTVDQMVQSGLAKIAEHLPFESPTADMKSFEYREADGALVYVLKYGIPQLLAKRHIEIKSLGRVATEKEIEDMVLEQLDSLRNAQTHGLGRYAIDSYQRQGFHTNYSKYLIAEMKRKTSSPVKKFEQYQEIIPQGEIAAWTLFTPQISSWAAQRYLETGEEHYYKRANDEFNHTLAQVTGEGEYHVIVGADGEYHVKQMPANQFPECYIALTGAGGITLTVASPHTPLNWTVAEAGKATATLIAATQQKETVRQN